MNATDLTETKQVLIDYLDGNSSVSDVSFKMSEVRWDDDASEELRLRASEIELVATEVGEGLRQEPELLAQVEKLLSSSSFL